MRASIAAGLWAVLTASGVAVLPAQVVTDTVRAATRQQLEALLTSYAPAQAMRFRSGATRPFDFFGSFDRDLRYAQRLEIIISVTTQRTIGFRVYPSWRGGHVNLNQVRQRGAVMQMLLHQADHSFFHWAADSALDVFAGFTFTLESGFPVEAIKVVIRSIPLLDDPFVARLGSYAE